MSVEPRVKKVTSVVDVRKLETLLLPYVVIGIK